VARLAARSPKLRRAMAAAKEAGYAHVVIDGTLIPTDRVAAGRPFCSGKHHRHGMNPQVIASPDGAIVGWASAISGLSTPAPAVRSSILPPTRRSVVLHARRGRGGGGAGGVSVVRWPSG
jgi:hypothetical protein